MVLSTGRMRWFGHVESSTGWISEVCKLNVVAQKRSGRPRKSWDEVIKNDRKKLDMDSAGPQNRSERRGVQFFSLIQNIKRILKSSWKYLRVKITPSNLFLYSKNEV